MSERPWSSEEIAERMQTLHDEIEEAHHELRALGDTAAKLKWEYRRQEAKAARSAKGRTQKDRDREMFAYQITPGFTLADLGENRDRAAAALEAQETVLKAMGEQVRLVQSLHVTAREAEPGGRR